LKIALVQYSPVWENRESSQKKITVFLENLEKDVSLIIFPELTLTGFTMRSRRFGEGIDGHTVNFFSDLAKTHSVHILAGFIEAINNEYYNTLIHLNDDGKIVKKYHKIHPFTFTGEDRHYRSGKKPEITQIGNITIGLSICYDLRFPELYRFYAREKVDLIVDIANWPEARIDHWYSLLKARSIENLSYVVGVNRVGEDKANHYVGWSTLFHPGGKEIICIKDEMAIAYVHINKDAVREVRKKYPFLDDIKLI